MAKINNNNNKMKKNSNNNYAEFRLRHRPFLAGEHKKNSNKKCQTADHNNKGWQGKAKGIFRFTCTNKREAEAPKEYLRFNKILILFTHRRHFKEVFNCSPVKRGPLNPSTPVANAILWLRIAQCGFLIKNTKKPHPRHKPHDNTVPAPPPPSCDP